MKSLVNLKALWRVVMFAILLPISSVLVAQTSDPAAISNLLKQAKVHAALVHDDVNTQEAYLRSSLNWQMHAICLKKIKRDANELIADMSQLQAMREKGTRSQREAIDRIAPLVQKMAVAFNTTIQTLNRSPNAANMPPFRERIRTNRVLIEEIYSTICQSVTRNYET